MEAESITVVEVIEMDIYEPVIAEMKAQIEECERVIATLELMRSKGPAVASKANSGSATTTSGTFSKDAFFGMTIAEGAKKYLAGIKRTATARAITEALLAGGLKSASKSPIENVRSILSRHMFFALVNGEFGLAEWYPGRKVKKQGSVSAINEDTDDLIVSHGAESSFVEQQRQESA